MARIRTVKPEYWTDGKIRRLSDSSALLFIALWNIADDYGYFSCDTLELAQLLPRWRSQSLHHMLCSLAAHGLIRVCSPLVVGQIISWEHQKIKDRRASKWNDLEIQWDDIKPNAQGSDRKPLRIKDLGSRIKDQGKELRKVRRATATPPEPLAPDTSKASQEFIVAYCRGFKERWGINPPIQGKDAGIAKRLVKSFSLRRLEQLLDAYFEMPDAWLVKQKHPLNLFESKITEVAVFADSGKFTTTKQVREADNMATTMQMLNDVKEGKL